MVKKIVCFFCFILIAFIQSNYADNKKSHLEQVQCVPELQDCLSKIQQLPEARMLIAAIQKEGTIRIIINADHYLTKKFGAFWDPVHRTITVNYSDNISEGSLIGSIVFEMHNALVNSKMLELDNLAVAGRIDRDTYVEEFERLEYKNSKDASKLVQRGIRRGIFPRSAHLPTYDSFEEHFYVQKEAGHSEFIGRNFDHLTPRKMRRVTSSSANRAW